MKDIYISQIKKFLKRFNYVTSKNIKQLKRLGFEKGYENNISYIEISDEGNFYGVFVYGFQSGYFPDRFDIFNEEDFEKFKQYITKNNEQNTKKSMLDN